MDWKKKLDINKHEDNNSSKKTSAKKYEVIQEMLNDKISHSIFNKDITQENGNPKEEEIAEKCNAEDIKNLQMCFFTFFAFIGITSFFFSGASVPANTTYLLGIDIATIYPLLQTTNYLLMLAMIPPLFNNIRGSNKFTRSIFGFLPKYGKYKIGKILTTFMLTFTASTGISFLNSWGVFDPQPVVSTKTNVQEEELMNHYKKLIEQQHAKINEMKHIVELKQKADSVDRMEQIKKLEDLRIKEAIADQELQTQAKIDALEKSRKSKKDNNTNNESKNLHQQNQEMDEQSIKYLHQIMQESYKKQEINVSK